MGKYLNIFDTIYSVFGSAAWNLNNIKTIPANYLEKINANCVRISVIPSGDSDFRKMTSGIIIADIFVKTGEGPKDIAIIADLLDTYLTGKTFQVGLDTIQIPNESSLSLIGIDEDNDALYRAKYEIVFNHFGV